MVRPAKEKQYDVIIVGAGPAGIFAALEISANSKLRVLMLDKGKDIAKRICPTRVSAVGCKQCKPCDLLFGWGGSGAFSDGKLTFSTDIGGQLAALLPKEKVESFIRHADEIYLRFGAPKEIFGADEDRLRDLSRKAAIAHLTLIPYQLRHLGTEKCLAMAKGLHKHLAQHVDIATKCEVKHILAENSRIYGVETADGTIYRGKYCIVAPGRQGAAWLVEEARRLNLVTTINPVDLGVRVEVPAVMAEPITKDIYEPKLVFYSKHFDDRVRTFCMCPNGEVVTEYSDGVVTVNGHSYSEKKTDNTNFALLVSKTFTEPFKDPIAYGQYIARLANLLAGGVMVQRLGDLEYGRRSTWDRLKKSIVQPTLRDATPGDLSLVLPYRYLSNILEMLKALDVVAQGIYSRDTLLYGVEVKFYSSSLVVDQNLETRINNLFAAGDGAGITRGLMQASVSGIITAREILRREGKMLKDMHLLGAQR